MKLHILTLNWNGADKLEKLYRTLIMLDVDCFENIHWYIRDNGSKDNSIETIKSFGLMKSNQISLFEIGHNRDNFSQGMNYLFDKANPVDEDLILLLNNDVECVDVSAYIKMYNLMQKTNAGIVGARLTYPDTNRLQHAGVIFSKRYNEMPYHYKHQERSDDDSKMNRYFQAVTAAVMLIKASVFRKLNGFDPNFNWAFEDIDFCLRAGETGEKIAYCGQTLFLHEESASLKKNPVNKLFLNNNVSRFKQKWTGKYKIDHDLYLNDTDYNVIK